MASKDAHTYGSGKAVNTDIPKLDELSLASYRREIVAALRLELAHFLGGEFLQSFPQTLIDDFCVATARRDHPTGEMLTTLIAGFLSIYSNPESHDDAMNAYHFIDALNEKMKLS